MTQPLKDDLKTASAKAQTNNVDETATTLTKQLLTFATATSDTDTNLVNVTETIRAYLKRITAHVDIARKRSASMIFQGAVRDNATNKKKEDFETVASFMIDYDNKELTAADPEYMSHEDVYKLAKDSNFIGAVASSHSNTEERNTGRCVFPFAEPFVIYENDIDGSSTLWNALSYVMTKSLGFKSHDTTGDLFTQGFYEPCSPKTRAGVRFSELVNAKEEDNGKLLDWRDYVTAAKEKIAADKAYTGDISDKTWVFEDVDIALHRRMYPDFKWNEALGDLIGDDVDGQKWKMTCLFEHEHTSDTSDTSDTSTVVLNNPQRIKCLHEHCVERKHEGFVLEALETGVVAKEALFDTGLGGGSMNPLKDAENAANLPSKEIQAIVYRAVVCKDPDLLGDVRTTLKVTAKVSADDFKSRVKRVYKELVSHISPDALLGLTAAEIEIRKRYKHVAQIGGVYDLLLKESFGDDKIGKAIYDKVSPPDGQSEEKRIKQVLLGVGADKYDKLCYRPGVEDLAITEHAKGNGISGDIRLLNMWQPSECKPVEGDTKPWDDLIDNIMEGYKQSTKDYFLDTLAHLVQSPHIKQKHGVILSSKPGAGKGSLFKIIEQIVGSHNYIAASNKELQEGGMGFLEGVQVAVVNETKAANNQDTANNLNEPVTEPTIRIRKLFLNPYTIENPAIIFLLSNYNLPLYILKDDRRWLIIKVLSELLSEAFFDELHAWIENGGSAHVYYALMQRDLSNYKPDARPPETDAKTEMIEACQGETYNTLQDLYDAGVAPFNNEVVSLPAVMKGLKVHFPKITRPAVMNFIRDRGGDILGKEAVEFSTFDKHGKTTGEAKRRLWALKNLKKWQQADKDTLGRAASYIVNDLNVYV